MPILKGRWQRVLYRLPRMILVLASLIGVRCGYREADSAVPALAFAGTSLQPASGPLRVSVDNPRYFTDGSGKAIYLTGSHTWANLQDAGASDPPPVFDYPAYLAYLRAHNHNFFRLWSWEQAKWAPWSADATWFAPSVYERTGPGNALDGKPRFDLTRFNQAYFDRMRARIVEAGAQGIYVSVMLFDGWSVGRKPGAPGNPWSGHPYNANNNVNGVNGDPNGDGDGYEVQTLAISEITALQEAYVRKVIDTVNDLDNVLYEICNESNQGSQEIRWQYHMIDLIHEYEASKPKQHPVGMTVPYPNGVNADLFASPAEWISPNEGGGYQTDPPAADGSKVVVVDTDHLWGVGGDRQWLWKSFARGLNTIYMDCYRAIYCEGVNLNDPTRLSVIANMGYARMYADRMNLSTMTPRGDLCSTSYCLANPAPSGAEYLVYLPSGGSATVDLGGSSGQLRVEWLNPATGGIVEGETVSGGAARSFTAPFGGDAVLYIYQDQATPPEISSIAVRSLDIVARFTWVTDRPATSQVEYGTSLDLGTSPTETTAHVREHSVFVAGLLPDTEYYYRVHSRGVDGASSSSEIASFRTVATEALRWTYLPIIMRDLGS